MCGRPWLHSTHNIQLQGAQAELAKAPSRKISEIDNNLGPVQAIAETKETNSRRKPKNAKKDEGMPSLPRPALMP